MGGTHCMVSIVYGSGDADDINFVDKIMNLLFLGMPKCFLYHFAFDCALEQTPAGSAGSTPLPCTLFRNFVAPIFSFTAWFFT